MRENPFLNVKMLCRKSLFPDHNRLRLFVVSDVTNDPEIEHTIPTDQFRLAYQPHLVIPMLPDEVIYQHCSVSISLAVGKDHDLLQPAVTLPLRAGHGVWVRMWGDSNHIGPYDPSINLKGCATLTLYELHAVSIWIPDLADC